MVTAERIDDLELFDKSEVARRVKLGVRTIEQLAKDPECPLKFIKPARGAGKRVVCTAQTLREFIRWHLGQ